MHVPAVILAVLIRALSAPAGAEHEAFTMPSGSMMPTLMVGDLFFVSHGAFDTDPPARGDVVVFRLPQDPTVSHVKRIIGLPGDVVQMIDGVLHLNGATVPRTRIDDFTFTDRQGRPETLARFVETLPGGRTFEILEISDDAPMDNTDRTAVPDGHYFVIGDNRDNSLDSRAALQMGLIPAANLVGLALFRRPGASSGGTLETID